MWEAIRWESPVLAGSAPKAVTSTGAIGTMIANQNRHMIGAAYHYWPSGVEMSVAGGGVNLNVAPGSGARVWFEYVVIIRSPFGCNMSVRSACKLSLMRIVSF